LLTGKLISIFYYISVKLPNTFSDQLVIRISELVPNTEVNIISMLVVGGFINLCIYVVYLLFMWWYTSTKNKLDLKARLLRIDAAYHNNVTQGYQPRWLPDIGSIIKENNLTIQENSENGVVTVKLYLADKMIKQFYDTLTEPALFLMYKYIVENYKCSSKPPKKE